MAVAGCLQLNEGLLTVIRAVTGDKAGQSVEPRNQCVGHTLLRDAEEGEWEELQTNRNPSINNKEIKT